MSHGKEIEILIFPSNDENSDVRVLTENFKVGKTQIADIVSNNDDIYKSWVENRLKTKIN